MSDAGLDHLLELLERYRQRATDGAVAALYRVGGCPTFAYAFPGGTLEIASIGDLDAAGLGARVERLLAASRAAQGS